VDDRPTHFWDLTRPVYSGMTVPPGDPPVLLATARSHQADGYAVTEICFGSHSGTHVDAPRHFFPLGKTLDQYPLERFVGPAMLLDCSLGAHGRAIHGASLAEHFGAFQPLPRDGIVLIRTGGRQLAVDAAQLLVDLGVGMVGCDSPSLDEEPYPVHKLLLGQGVLLLENLRGLDEIEPGPLVCACLPLLFAGSEAAPARVVAWR
jgi:arylformamidase